MTASDKMNINVQNQVHQNSLADEIFRLEYVFYFPEIIFSLYLWCNKINPAQ